MRPMTRLTARTDETASTGSLTQSGTAVVNFGNDVPANLLDVDCAGGYGGAGRPAAYA